MEQPVLRIPPGQLSSEALQGLVEEFVAREGTDYGEVEMSRAQKTAQVFSQLDRGDAVILFDPLTESCTIVPKSELRALGISERDDKPAIDA
jgi:uncharacterized protein YheU (UPF0270 family)